MLIKMKDVCSIFFRITVTNVFDYCRLVQFRARFIENVAIRQKTCTEEEKVGDLFIPRLYRVKSVHLISRRSSWRVLWSRDW